MESIVPNDNRHCAPKVDRKNETCLSYEMLILLANLYNNSHSDKIEIVAKKNKKTLWKALQDKLRNTCGNNEACWIEQPWVRNKEKLEENFRPKKPSSWNKNPNEWLNTYDIQDVMKQYEENDKVFYFVGVFPVDFAAMNASRGTCIVQEMCQLDLKDCWSRGIKKIGVVFNLDKHDQSGSHWVGLYIGLNPRSKNFGVYYYDSVAMNPPKEIAKFMKEKQKELERLHPKCRDKIELQVNKKRRQYKNSNCGIFSMLFVIMMLKNKFSLVQEKMGRDDDVQKYRDILYRPV